MDGFPAAIGLALVVGACAGAASPSATAPTDRIVFQSDRGGDFDIYHLHADGTGLRQLTDDPADEGTPAWSPDGSRIAFASGTLETRMFDIWVMNADGTRGSA